MFGLFTSQIPLSTSSFFKHMTMWDNEALQLCGSLQSQGQRCRDELTCIKNGMQMCLDPFLRIRELKRYSRYMGYVSPWISPSSISLQLRWMGVIVLILWLTEFAHICAKTVVSKVLPDFLSSVSCLVLSENAAAARWAGRLRVASPNWCIAKRESAHCRHAHSLAKHWHQIAWNGSNWG